MMRLVGAGICLDFCHFGVAWGQDFLSQVDGDMLEAVNHIHYSDTDCRTRELHFPPGRGVLDLAALTDVLAGRRLSAAWDLFSWPTPIQAITDSFDTYRRFVAQVSS
jgi:sugar phosphate isomerase/epimerase